MDDLFLMVVWLMALSAWFLAGGAVATIINYLRRKR